MMNGDEPQLGGQDTDNSPMIGGWCKHLHLVSGKAFGFDPYIKCADCEAVLITGGDYISMGHEERRLYDENPRRWFDLRRGEEWQRGNRD